MNKPAPTDPAGGREVTLTGMIRHRARTNPEAIAIQTVTGETWSWMNVATAMESWTEALRKLGLSAGDRVLTLMPNSPEAYLAWLGTCGVGATEVPVNTAFQGKMLQYVISNSRPRMILTTEAHLREVGAALRNVAGSNPLVVAVEGETSHANDVNLTDAEVIPPSEFKRIVASCTETSNLVDIEPYDVAVMIYTSGTTGPSKGVLVPWTELFTFIDHRAPGMIPAGGAYYSPYPPFHISGKTALMNAAHWDARLVLRDGFSASRFWSDIRDFDCTSVMLVGPLASILLQQEARADDHENPLKFVNLGPLPADLDAFKKRFGVDVATAYGSTEIGMPLVSGWELPNSRTCGRLRDGFPGYEARIVDAHDRPLPTGEVGELVVRSNEPWALSSGYFEMPEKTAEAWRNGWFHTGDAFTVDEDGWFYFVDRMKDTIRRRGENISSFEVESCINDHPDVIESVAIGVPSPLGEEEIMAFVRVIPGSTLTPGELLDFLVDTSPPFMIPRFVEFTESFPKTDATQRTRKFELRSRGVGSTTWDRSTAGWVKS